MNVLVWLLFLLLVFSSHFGAHYLINLHLLTCLAPPKKMSLQEFISNECMSNIIFMVYSHQRFAAAVPIFFDILTFKLMVDPGPMTRSILHPSRYQSRRTADIQAPMTCFGQATAPTATAIVAWHSWTMVRPIL